MDELRFLLIHFIFEEVCIPRYITKHNEASYYEPPKDTQLTVRHSRGRMDFNRYNEINGILTKICGILSVL
jgi:hypothetical protein